MPGERPVFAESPTAKNLLWFMSVPVAAVVVIGVPSFFWLTSMQASSYERIIHEKDAHIEVLTARVDEAQREQDSSDQTQRRLDETRRLLDEANAQLAGETARSRELDARLQTLLEGDWERRYHLERAQSVAAGERVTRLEAQLGDEREAASQQIAILRADLANERESTTATATKPLESLDEAMHRILALQSENRDLAHRATESDRRYANAAADLHASRAECERLRTFVNPPTTQLSARERQQRVSGLATAVTSMGTRDAAAAAIAEFRRLPAPITSQELSEVLGRIHSSRDRLAVLTAVAERVEWPLPSNRVDAILPHSSNDRAAAIRSITTAQRPTP